MKPLPEAFQQVLDVRERLTDLFLGRRNVIACGIGYKIRDGELTRIPSLIISVSRKLPESELREEDIIPAEVNDVVTDVVETGEIRPLAFNRGARIRPVRPGVSIGHINGTAGTAGCVVVREGQPYILTNNHVAAQLNEAELGDLILQPGPSDGGTVDDAFGQLADFVPLRFLGEEPEPPTEPDDEPEGCAALLASLFPSREASTVAAPEALADKRNRVDGSLVRPLRDIKLDPRIVDIGAPPAGIGEIGLGDMVVKSGRTTGLTQGMVTQIAVTVDVNYDGRKARFTDQIMATPFSQRGDSGSLVLDDQRQAVGLIFSGSDSVSVFHPIAVVLEKLQIQLYTP